MSNYRVLDALVRSNFHIFIRKVFETLHPGMPLLDNWHIEAIAHQLQSVQSGGLRRSIITMPPRSLKSICASVAFPAFALGHNPSLKIICVSYSQDLPGVFSRQFRQVLESDWYKRIYPKVRVTKSSEGLVETSMGGGRFATSVGGALTGFGGNLIIVDDPLNAADAQSEAARKRVNEFYSNTLLSRIDNPATGAIVIVMQRLHEDDLAGHLLEKEPENWQELRLAAIAEEDETIPVDENNFKFRKKGELLHPARLNPAVLDERRKSLGSAAFSAQYQQSPVPAEGALLKRNWIKSYSLLPERGQRKVTQSWDTAMKDSVSADYSVCTTWLEVNGSHFLIDVLRQKLAFPDLVKRTQEQFSKHRPDAILIEARASGISLSQHLGGTSGYPIIERRPDKDKLVRFDKILPLFEAGKVSFPDDAPWLADLLKELLGFPSAKHDDQVDSVSQYLGWAVERSAHAKFDADFFHGEADPTAGQIADLLIERPVLGAPLY